MCKEKTFGVITEQGDLGLGFNPLDEKDNAVMENAMNNQQPQQPINEENNNQ